MKTQSYPSDLTEEQFEWIKPLLVKEITAGRRFTYDLKNTFDALLYIKSSGCSWRSLPHDFDVPWPTVYYHFKKFKEKNIFQKITLILNKKNRKNTKQSNTKVKKSIKIKLQQPLSLILDL